MGWKTIYNGSYLLIFNVTLFSYICLFFSIFMLLKHFIQFTQTPNPNGMDEYKYFSVMDDNSLLVLLLLLLLLLLLVFIYIWIFLHFCRYFQLVWGGKNGRETERHIVTSIWWLIWLWRCGIYGSMWLLWINPEII